MVSNAGRTFAFLKEKKCSFFDTSRGKSLRDPNWIRLLNSRSDLDLEIGIVRDMSETPVLLT